MAIPFQQLEGKYEILEKMSEGGMGAVYKVRHRLLDEVRVIKVMRPHLAEDEVLRKRFIREAKTATRLRHANLVQVYDFTMDESGYFFLAMEFIDGIDLHGLAKLTKVVPLGVVLEMAYQCLDVIGYLHKKEIVHRDISPDNLLACRDDEGELLVKLIDLGIAKVREGNEHLTATGTFLGKVRYSSPEQFRSQGGHEVDHRSDIYSFGIVLYELLTGVYPIKGKNISSLISGHLMHPPASFETSDPQGRIPDVLRALVLRALEKDQTERFQTAGEFQKVIGELREAFPVEKTFLDGVFEGQRIPTAKIRVSKPGSTQGRLDRNFGFETTPSQGGPSLPDPEMNLVPGPRSQRSGTEALPEGGDSGDHRTSADRQIRAADILSAAQLLMQDDQWEDAVPMIREVLVLTPGDAAAVELFGQAEKGLSSWVEKRRIQAEIEGTAAVIEASLQAEDIEGVRRSLKLAEKLYGDHSRFAGFPEKLRDLEARDRRRRVEVLRNEAAGLFDAGDFIAAGLKLEIALELEPDDQGLTSALAEAAESQRLKEEEDARRRIIEETSRGLDRLVAACRFSAAVTLLDGAAERLETFDEEPSLRVMVIEKAKVHQAMEKRIGKAVAKVWKAVDARDFERARIAIDEAREMVSKHPEALDVVDQAAEAFRAGESDYRREKDIAAAAGSIEKRLEEGQLDQAERELVLARRLYGPKLVFDELAARAAEMNKAQERVRRRMEIQEALDAKAPFSEVIAMIEAVLAFDPRDSDFRGLWVETRRAQREDAEIRCRPAIEEVLDEVDMLIAGGRETEALRVLDGAIEELGPFSEARALKLRLGKSG